VRRRFPAAERLDDAAFDVPAHLQQLDFKVLRSYRENLLVHAGVPLDRRPAPGRLSRLFVSAPVSAVEGEADVYDIGQKRVRLTEPSLRRVIDRVGEAWPAACRSRIWASTRNMRARCCGCIGAASSSFTPSRQLIRAGPVPTGGKSLARCKPLAAAQD